ncbi:hypothetical protein Aoki45_06330 [Algoriphagus sp. oki45]|nr:hypothetical protein Aoki45_06330 [Algoriphagus sp. oki45]
MPPVNHTLNQVKRALFIVGLLSLTSVFFYSCNQNPSTESASATTETGVASGDLKVAFVYTDSVINKYDLFKKKSEEITEKGRKFEGDLQSRARGFEQEVATFQQTGGNMTPNQQRAKQEELMQKEQNLMTYRNNLMQELSADEATLYNEVYDQVQTYLNEYAKEQGYDVILSYTRGGAMWYASEAMDITTAVVEGLNKKYNQGSTPAPAAKSDSTATK